MSREMQHKILDLEQFFFTLWAEFLEVFTFLIIRTKIMDPKQSPSKVKTLLWKVFLMTLNKYTTST